MFKYWKFFVLIASVASALMSYNEDFYFKILPLLPLMYGVLYCCFVPSKIYVGAGFVTLNLVLFLRYIVYPIELKSSDFHIMGNAELVVYAVPLMILEMFVILVTIYRYAGRSSIVNKVHHFTRYEQTNNIIPIICAIVLSFIVVFFPQAFLNERWIWESELINEDVESVSGVYTQIATWCQFFILISLFTFFYNKYLKSKNNVWYWLSLIILFVPCLSYSGHSRMSMLVPLIAYVFFVMKIYSTKVNKVIIIVGIYAIVAMVSLTLQKFFSTMSLVDLDSEIEYSMLNAYFGGLDNVLIGLETYQKYGTSALLLPIDSLRNAMGISKFFAGAESTVHLFNEVVYSRFFWSSMDKIPPTIYQGLMYFGPILCFIPTLLMTRVVCHFDKLFAQSNNLFLSYLYLNFVIPIAWALPGNFMHMTSRIFNYLIPLYLLIAINKSLFRRRNY